MTALYRLRMVWGANVAFLAVYWAIGGALREEWAASARLGQYGWLAPVLAFGAVCTIPGVRRLGIPYGPACLLAWGFAEASALVGFVAWVDGRPATWFAVTSVVYVTAMVWLFPTRGAMERHEALRRP